jgi:AcrR family transcriptional regulator
VYGVHVSSDQGRARLNRDRVLRTAVELADREGVDAVSMRRLAEQLGVVPMALYKHVAHKEELLDGMVDVVLGEIAPADADADWRTSVRARVLAARQTLLAHPWAPHVIETRTGASPVVLAHMEALIAAFRRGGLSADLTHHAMHALGSRMWGFTQEVFPTPEPPDDPALREQVFRQVAALYPHIIEIASAGAHDPGTAVGSTCDDQFEFEFALDLFLDGIETLHARGWTSRKARRSRQRPR